MISLRRRLLVGLLVAVGMVWLAVAGVIYLIAQHETEEVLDAQLAQYARVLQALVAAEPDGTGTRPATTLTIGTYSALAPAQGHDYEQKLRFLVWNAAGDLLVRSTDAPAERAPPLSGGYADESVDGQGWRAFTLVSGAEGLRVYVAERDDIRQELVGNVVVSQMMPGLLALPFFGLVIWIVVGRGLRPLGRVEKEVANRSPEQLEPLRVTGIPTEIKSLVDGLNRLFQRLQTAFERERRFIADAAHELRTPLAAIKTQAQTALAADDERQRRHALDNIVRGVDRATHLEAQLLTLARLDPEARTFLRPRDVNFAPLARQIVAEAAPRAVAKNIDLGLEVADTLEIHGDADLLAVLLRNLVENAVRHTPNGGTVTVAFVREADGIVLSVVDSGPGISEEEKERVFERFYRAHDQYGAGSGLGLSIVKRVADLHGADVSLRNRAEGGLQATVRLPFAR